MTRLVALAVTLLLGCTRQEPSSSVSQVTDDQRRLRAIFEKGAGDPVGDARRAAQRRDFRLFWQEDHWGGPTLIGLHCRIPRGAAFRPSRLLTIMTGTGSPLCGSLGEVRACEIEDRLRLYAPVYNRALISSPAFPYPDLCTAENLSDSVHPPLHAPEDFPSEGSAMTESPRNLGEAARRGSRASVERMLRGLNVAELDRPDGLGLTPLAWAVIERRPTIARLLIEHGADPIAGRPGARTSGVEVPLVIALRSGQNELADRMITPDIARRLRPWPNVVLEAAERGGNQRLVRLITAERERAARVRAMQERERNRAAERARRESFETGQSIQKILRTN